MHRQIVKYNKTNLYCCWEERINKGIETRPICWDCSEPTGEWNRNFIPGYLCNKCWRKKFLEDLEDYAKNNQQGEH
jgi:hypothetical protein